MHKSLTLYITDTTSVALGTITSVIGNTSTIHREVRSIGFSIRCEKVSLILILFGHCFELVTDHKPLLALLHEHKPTSAQASARIRRWSLLLSANEYKISFRKTEDHAHGCT